MLVSKRNFKLSNVFQLFQFSQSTTPPPPTTVIFPSYIMLTIFNIPPPALADSSIHFLIFPPIFAIPSFNARRYDDTSHFIHTALSQRESIRLLPLLDVLTKLPVSCRSLSSTCLQREILPTRIIDVIFWVSRVTVVN